MAFVRKAETWNVLTAKSRVFIGTVGAIGLTIAHFPFVQDTDHCGK